MVFLNTAKKYLRVLGILPLLERSLPLSLREFRTQLNVAHISSGVVCLLLYLLSVVCYLLFEAKTFAEFSEASLFLAITLARNTFYFVLVWKKTELSTLISDVEEIIQKSEFELRIIWCYQFFSNFSKMNIFLFRNSGFQGRRDLSQRKFEG